MPENERRIIGIAIDVGTIQKAWRRIQLRRATNRFAAAEHKMASMQELIQSIINRLVSEQEKPDPEEEQDKGTHN